LLNFVSHPCLPTATPSLPAAAAAAAAAAEAAAAAAAATWLAGAVPRRA